jgi:hypothetical protein
MTTEHITGAPFNENAQVVVRTDANYTMNNQDDVIDVLGPGVTISLPPHPVFGQLHKIVAGAGFVLVFGNGHPIGGFSTIVPTLRAAEYIFSSSGGGSGQWISMCCAEGQG